MGEPTIRGEVVLPRRVVPQPVPFVVPNGDCGGCVLAGAFGISVPEAYEKLHDGKLATFEHNHMYSALHQATYLGLADRIITDHPMWLHIHESMQTWGNPSWTQALSWFANLRMAMDAGYYAFARVNHAKAGPWQPPDHWVLLVGVREVGPPEGESGVIHQQVLVSCSSRTTPAEEWVDVREFLQKRGGFDLFKARPIVKEEVKPAPVPTMTPDEISQAVEVAMERSKQLVKDALKLGRSMTGISREDLTLIVR